MQSAKWSSNRSQMADSGLGVKFVFNWAYWDFPIKVTSNANGRQGDTSQMVCDMTTTWS